LKTAFFSEQHLRLETTLVTGTILFCACVSANLTEWFFIIVSGGILLITEMLNTSIEYLCDALHPEHSEKIGKVKDIAAGSVLLSACVFFTIAMLIIVARLTF
jgi:diacylglycerol kinase